VVAPCANCKKQLRELCEDNGLEDVEVVGLHDLLLKVIDFGNGAGAHGSRAKDQDTSAEAEGESAEYSDG